VLTYVHTYTYDISKLFNKLIVHVISTNDVSLESISNLH